MLCVVSPAILRGYRDRTCWILLVWTSTDLLYLDKTPGTSGLCQAYKPCYFRLMLLSLCKARERALLPMLSLCVSFLMGMVKLKEMMVFLGIRQLMENLASKTEREEHDAKDKDIEYFDSSLAAVRRHAICVKISMALMAGALFTACFTLYAVLSCSGGIRSLTGCIDIPD